MNGLAHRKIRSRNDSVLADLFPRAGILPGIPNFLQSVNHVGREPFLREWAGALRMRVQNLLFRGTSQS